MFRWIVFQTSPATGVPEAAAMDSLKLDVRLRRLFSSFVPINGENLQAEQTPPELLKHRRCLGLLVFVSSAVRGRDR
ncbi:hypothetical protein, partial [uncultured Jannaschia sp.]|uniref:hypothetical protein n=1 Tax=uncultured Jannaschia sp. TaxID=293347 RepID=UPI0026052FBB